MPCPYAQMNSEDVEDRTDNEFDDDSGIIDELSNNVASTEYGNTNQDKEPVDYNTYLDLNTLLSIQKCYSHIDPSDNTSPPVHDEHLFILIHQVFELWFKQILFEIDSIRDIFANNISDITPFVFNINLRLNRIVKIWKIIIDQFQILDSMTPMEFLEFRDFLTSGSGFQSLQFRLIEIKLGLTDPFRNAYKTEYFTRAVFKDKHAKQFKRAIEEDSLLRHIERWLEQIYQSTSSFRFLDVYKTAIQRMIDYKKEEKLRNGVDVKTVESYVETTERQFRKMTDPIEYEELLKNHERRISHKAMLAALMISQYHQELCFQQPYQILSLLMDINGLMASWRHQHVLLVQRQIGRKAGTGGTDGFLYLYKTISDKYQTFNDLCNVSSYLIPRRFLPKFVNNCTASNTTVSSFTLQPDVETPIIRHKQQQQQISSPQDQSTRKFIQYYHIPFFFFLFITGWVFDIFIRGCLR